MKKNKNITRLFLTDFLLLNLSVFLVYLLKIRNFPAYQVFNPFNVKVFILLTLGLNVSWFVFFLIFHKKLGVGEKLEQYSTIFKAIFFGIILIYIITFFVKTSATSLSWFWLFSYWIFTYLLVMTGKWFVHLIQIDLFIRPKQLKRVIIIGKSEKADEIKRTIRDFPSLGYGFAGFVDNDGAKKNLGNFEQIKEIIAENNVREVIVAYREEKKEKIAGVIRQLQQQNVKISVTDDLYQMITGLGKIEILDGLPLIRLNPESLTEEQKIIKRFIDIVFSSLFLIFVSPVCLIIALLIKFDSRGTIFFKQKRMLDKKNEYFMIKFRSMKMDAENESGPVWAKINDDRATRVGHFLRKYWLDEIPQFLNVLKGEMSMVGPRPERLFFVKKLEKEIPFYRRRFVVKPGITGWAQVKHKYDETIEDVHQKLKFDFFYIENFSLWLDIKIIFLTCYLIIFGKGR